MWCVEERVLFVRYDGELSPAVMQSMNQEIEALLNQASQPIHFISDISIGQSISETSVFRIQILLKGFSILRHPMLGWNIFCMHGNTFLKMTTGIVMQIAQVRYRIFESREEAVNFLCENVEGLAEAAWHLPAQG
jgi:hypothetical protein